MSQQGVGVLLRGAMMAQRAPMQRVSPTRTHFVVHPKNLLAGSPSVSVEMLSSMQESDIAS